MSHRAQVLGGVLKSDAKSGGAGNNMLLGCLCLIANTVSMVRCHWCLQWQLFTASGFRPWVLAVECFTLPVSPLSPQWVQALYYILAKHLVQRYNPVCIAAWAYIVAATMMGTTALLSVQRNEWTVPSAMFGPLIYWCAFHLLSQLLRAVIDTPVLHKNLQAIDS